VDPAPDGIALSRSYFEGAVAPVLSRHLPDVRYAAARVGPGSDVLGMDDAMSRDHDWGLRLQLFVDEHDAPPVRSALDRHLPGEFRGYPVRFGFSTDPAERVRVDVTSVSAFAQQQLGFDPRLAAAAADWLSLTGQCVLEVVSGAVFEDRTGELTGLRAALEWYPDDLWRYIVACDWQRLDQELPVMGRAGDRGDDLGSRTIAARLVDTVVHLAFMVSRSWPPYQKWRGTAFSRLPRAAAVGADLRQALEARHWQDRQQAIGAALDRLAGLQREIGLPAPPSPVAPFHDRPYLHLDRGLVPALLDTIDSPEVRALPVGVGGVEQQTDNVDVLTRPHRRRALARALTGDHR
jgi:hypothetical protein